MIRLSKNGSAGVLTLDRTEALNALSFEILRALDAILDEASALDIRALIITGAGEKAFCAGADIPELIGRAMVAERRGAQLGQAVFERLNRFRVPTIAAINGYAFGGGLEMALACTFRIAAPNAKMGLPEIKLGLIPGYGGTQRLPRLVGESVALDLILTGRTIDAKEALHIGLINRIADGDLLDQAFEFAKQFTGFGLPALELARDAVQRALDMPIAEGLRMEADLSTLAYRTADAQAGLQAFIDKQPAIFNDC